MEKDAPRNGHWVLYYDGGCGLCTWVVRWLDRLDPFHRVQWVPAQSLEAPPLGLSWQQLHDAAYLQTGRGRLHEGFYAFRKLTTGVPSPSPPGPGLLVSGHALPGCAGLSLGGKEPLPHLALPGPGVRGRAFLAPGRRAAERPLREGCRRLWA